MELAKNLKLLQLPLEKQLFSTILDDFSSSQICANVDAVAPCTHDEADTRIFLHVAAAASVGHRRVIVRTTDSDVVVLGVSTCVALAHEIDELWIAFGSGRNYRYIPAHVIARDLGPSKAKALPAFHALTGCDTTSSFFNKGKKTAWSVWQSLPELTLALEQFSCPYINIETVRVHTKILEKFVVKLYGVNEKEITGVDAARHSLVLSKGKDSEHIPPSSDALHQYFLRVAYQSGHVWGNALNKSPTPVSPTDWGWQHESPDSVPTQDFTTLPIISKNMPEIVGCHCKNEYRAPCSCRKYRQPCMVLCTCKCRENEVCTDSELC